MSRLRAALQRGDFVVTAELAPPRHADPARVLQQARDLAPWTHALNVTDNQTATARMSALAFAALMVRDGLEPILQVTCRDRNRLALTSDLLGATALGIPNVLAMTGDPPTQGDHPDAKPVFDLDGNGLVRLAAGLNAGTMLNGREVVHPTSLFIGGTANPFGGDPATGARILAERQAAGAAFVQTQWVYDVPAFAAWLGAVRDAMPSPPWIIAGIGPVRDGAQARRLAAIPGISIPGDLIDRLETAPAPADAEAAGLDAACVVIEALRDLGVAGVHLMPVGWPAAVPAITERLGLKPRP